jgi:hypothetical protein
MSTTVKFATALFPSSSVALTMWGPSSVWVGTVMMAVKLPQVAVKGFGSVGMSSPSQVMFILEQDENPEPTMVVDANPVSGTRAITGVHAMETTPLPVQLRPFTAIVTKAIAKANTAYFSNNFLLKYFLSPFNFYALAPLPASSVI